MSTEPRRSGVRGLPTLADLVAGAVGTSTVHFLDEDRHCPLGELWDQGSGAVTLGGGPVAMVLSNTSACVATLLGAIGAGLTVISLPIPARGSDPVWYEQLIRSICTSARAERVVLDAALVPLAPRIDGVEVTSYDAVLKERRSGPRDPGRFELVQFTSGSTSAPKGIHLPQEKVVANILAILERLEITSGDGMCSWLPLSHDMGLIGMTLGSFVAGGPDFASGTNVVLMDPTTFVRDPSQWLAACAHFGSTITCTPNFGLEMAMRNRTAISSLGCIRACIVGAEPVRPSTLTSFERAFASDGFRANAFCPAYGLAEAALAVSMIRPSEPWHAIDRAELSKDGDGAAAGTKIVSAGAPLTGYEVRTAVAGELSELMLRGPSLLDRYSDGREPLDDAGWFRTSDLGGVLGDEVYVAGRVDDVFLIGGRNIYAIDVESAIEGSEGIRLGRHVAVQAGDGGLVIVAEVERGFTPGARAEGRARADIDRRMVERGMVAAERVVLVRPGTLPMTSSGKIQRTLVATAFADGTLQPVEGDAEPAPG